MLENPAISINYFLTYQEFISGHKLGTKQSTFTFAYSIFTRYIATIAAVLLSILILFSEFDGSRSVVPRLLPAAILLWLVPVSVWRSRRTSYKHLKTSNGNPSELIFQADRTSFTRRIHNQGELTWLWSATAGIAKNKSMLLIMVRKGAFIMIPRRVISDGQISLLEEMLRQGNSAASC